MTARVAKVSNDNLSDADLVANQNAVAISQSDNLVTIRQIGELTSVVGGEGEHEYVAIDVDTGLDTIVGAKWGDYTMTSEDAAEAASVGLPAGHLVYYAACDALSSPRTIVLKSGTYEYAFVVEFVPMS